MAYCFDEACDTWGTFIQGELNGIKQNKKESPEHHAGRKQRKLMQMLGLKDQIRYASPG